MFVAHEFAYHQRAREQQDNHWQEEQQNDDGREVDALAHSGHFDHTAELVGDERDWPSHVVTVTLHKVGPVLLRVRTVVEGRQSNKRA